MSLRNLTEGNLDERHLQARVSALRPLAQNRFGDADNVSLDHQRLAVLERGFMGYLLRKFAESIEILWASFAVYSRIIFFEWF